MRHRHVIGAASLLLPASCEASATFSFSSATCLGLIHLRVRHFLVRVLLRLGDVVLHFRRGFGLVAAGERKQRRGRKETQQFRIHRAFTSFDAFLRRLTLRARRSSGSAGRGLVPWVQAAANHLVFMAARDGDRSSLAGADGGRT